MHIFGYILDMLIIHSDIKCSSDQQYINAINAPQLGDSLFIRVVQTSDHGTVGYIDLLIIIFQKYLKKNM